MNDKRCDECPHKTVVGHWDGRDPVTGKRTSGFTYGCTKKECAIYRKANEEIAAEKRAVQEANRKNGVDIWELKRMRTETGTTIKKAANHIGAGLVQYSDWEKERKPMPKEQYDRMVDFFKAKEEADPPEVLVCIHCGKKTMVGRRTKSNGHFHGRCTNCGSTVIA